MRGTHASATGQHRFALAADPHLAVLRRLVAHARQLVAVGAHQLHVRDVYERLDVDDPALVELLAGAGALGPGAGVALGHPDAVDHHAALVRQHTEHAALLASILTRDHPDQVVTFDVHGRHLQHLRSERDDLHEALLAELTRNRPEDAGAARVPGVGREDHDRVVVEADVRAVGPAAFLGGAHDDGLHDLALLHGPTGQGVLHGGDDHVADAGVAARGTPEHADAQDLFGPCVVRNLAPGFLLDHFARSRISTTRQRLDLLIGRVSITRTVSPTCASFVSSCAASLVLRRTVLPYRPWRTCRSIRTRTVLSIPSETTTPVRTLRRTRSLVWVSLTIPLPGLLAVLLVLPAVVLRLPSARCGRPRASRRRPGRARSRAPPPGGAPAAPSARAPRRGGAPSGARICGAGRSGAGTGG